MRSVLVFGLLAAVAVPALAEDPLTTLSASYSFTAQDGAGDDWVSGQSASLGLSARWGATLVLDGQLRAPFDQSSLTADQLLSKLTITWNLNEWSVITFGKQRLKWGTARVFSAVDGLEAVYDPLHPKAVLDGITGVKAEWLPNDWLSVSALVLPAPVLKNSRQALRADVLWNEADLSAGAIHSAAHGKDRWTAYADAAWFLDRFGVYAEAEYKSWRDRGAETDVWVPKATGGLQVEFPVWLNGTLRWLTEYHYDGEGFTPAEAGGFHRDWEAKTAVIPESLGVASFSRHYGYTGLSGLPLTEKISAEASVLAGLDTGFFIARGGLNYAVDQNLSASLDYTRFGTVPGGPPDSEKILVSATHQVGFSVAASY